ncbi:MAG: glycosyltransferase [Chitinophagaceae bacterium]
MVVVIDFRNTGIDYSALSMFTGELWQDIVSSHPAHHFIFITRKKTITQTAGNLVAFQLLRTGLGWVDKKILQRKLTKWQADRLITLHDTGFTVRQLFQEKRLEKALKPDKRVSFTVSENTVVDGVAASVLQPAFRKVIADMSWTEAESIKTQYTGGRSFFLFAGDIVEAHQLIELLKAFSVFKKWQQSNMQLVIAGSITKWSSVLEEKLATYKYKQDVVMIRNAGNEVIAKLVAACYAMVYPGAVTGFPLGMLWAIQSNKAIIATDNATNKQFTQAAAWVADHNTAEGFARAMQLLYKDEQQQQLLVQQTKEQAKQINRQQLLATAWQCIAEG